MAIGKARAENVSLGRYNFVTLDKVLSWASADFFQGRAKFSRVRRVAKAYYLLITICP
jgi:hypothetical protein